MKTIRLSDPFPRGRPAEKLQWGSSAWAADSCLVEWSRLEREWLAPAGPQRTARPVWRWSASPWLPRFWLGALIAATTLAISTFF